MTKLISKMSLALIACGFILTQVGVAKAADWPVLTCKSAGDVITGATLVTTDDLRVFLVVPKMSGETTRYEFEPNVAVESFSNDGTFTFAKDWDVKYGDAVQGAVMLKVFKQKTQASLSMDGAVYHLTCSAQ